ncbi:hypothetical protein DFH06DRAFT_1435631 [Mycena polygramma]|nr:hypothetical protein DFH06DRAFT_1435631 [Mycena polygramma]
MIKRSRRARRCRLRHPATLACGDPCRLLSARLDPRVYASSEMSLDGHDRLPSVRLAACPSPALTTMRTATVSVHPPHITGGRRGECDHFAYYSQLCLAVLKRRVVALAPRAPNLAHGADVVGMLRGVCVWTLPLPDVLVAAVPLAQPGRAQGRSLPARPHPRLGDLICGVPGLPSPTPSSRPRARLQPQLGKAQERGASLLYPRVPPPLNSPPSRASPAHYGRTAGIWMWCGVAPQRVRRCHPVRHSAGTRRAHQLEARRFSAHCPAERASPPHCPSPRPRYHALRTSNACIPVHAPNLCAHAVRCPGCGIAGVAATEVHAADTFIAAVRDLRSVRVQFAVPSPPRARGWPTRTHLRAHTSPSLESRTNPLSRASPPVCRTAIKISSVYAPALKGPRRWREGGRAAEFAYLPSAALSCRPRPSYSSSCASGSSAPVGSAAVGCRTLNTSPTRYDTCAPSRLTEPHITAHFAVPCACFRRITTFSTPTTLSISSASLARSLPCAQGFDISLPLDPLSSLAQAGMGLG